MQQSTIRIGPIQELAVKELFCPAMKIHQFIFSKQVNKDMDEFRTTVHEFILPREETP